MASRRLKTAGRAAAAVAAVAGVVVLTRLLPLARWVSALEGTVRGWGAAGPLLYGAVYVIAVLLFVPGSLLTLAAGALFGVFWGTVLVSLASTTAAALAFLISRHLARRAVERLARRDERFAAIDQAIRDGGWRIVMLLRLSPLVPFGLSNYLYGLTPVAFGPYVLASWIAMLPATVLYVSIGAAGRAAATGGRSPLEWTLVGVGLAATLVATVMITRTARRKLRAYRERGAATVSSRP
jgi:uncharacterized membrane protein YdjX (TVP38/TMEM64 family)